MPSNDNARDPAAPALRAPDPSGHAALILVESLIHGLAARSILTAADALEIVTSAIDVQGDYVDKDEDAHPRSRQSQMLLSAIAESLKTDL